MRRALVGGRWGWLLALLLGAQTVQGGGVELVDQAGHMLRLSRPVMRVGTPGISMASLIVALGGAAQLDSVTPEVRDNPWLRRVLLGTAALATPFSRPAGVDLEALLARRPDLVTLWLSNTALGRRLERVGLPVLYLGYSTPEEFVQAVRLLATALGPAAAVQADALLTEYAANLQRVAAALADLDPAQRPRVYYASVAPLRSEGLESMVDAWIGAAGGINVVARAGLHGDVHVHLEDVLDWDPQVIVTLDAAQRRAILDDPRWQGVSAVRAGRVLVNPRGINAWCTRAAETVLQVLWAAQLFHPQRLADVDVGAAARAFYQRFYGYRLSDAELAHVLLGLAPPEADAVAAHSGPP